MNRAHLVIGSRGSDLALWQAHHVLSLLKSAFPELPTELKIIHTSGDLNQKDSLAKIGGQGAFTKEIEAALLRGEIDVAVHSMKDLPTLIEPLLTIAAIPERGFTEDAFLSREGAIPLAEIPAGGSVATGSIRRRAQLLHVRPDLNIVDIRGNVPTRIKKFLDSTLDGLILARAGLERLGLQQHITHSIPYEWILPAVGQGALAIQIREHEPEIQEIISALDHEETRAAVTSERALLRQMGSGCQLPVGANARVIDGILELRGLVVHPLGVSIIRGEHTGSIHDAERIGMALGDRLLREGGKEILDSIGQFDSSSARQTI